MPNMNVTYQDMYDAATRARQGQDDINSRLNELKSVMANLVADGFSTDKAGPAFNNSYNDFTNGATQAISGLTGMADYLNKAADAIAQADSDLANAIKN